MVVVATVDVVVAPSVVDVDGREVDEVDRDVRVVDVVDCGRFLVVDVDDDVDE